MINIMEKILFKSAYKKKLFEDFLPLSKCLLQSKINFNLKIIQGGNNIYFLVKKFYF